MIFLSNGNREWFHACTVTHDDRESVLSVRASVRLPRPETSHHPPAPLNQEAESMSISPAQPSVESASEPASLAAERIQFSDFSGIYEYGALVLIGVGPRSAIQPTKTTSAWSRSAPTSPSVLTRRRKPGLRGAHNLYKRSRLSASGLAPRMKAVRPSDLFSFTANG